MQLERSLGNPKSYRAFPCLKLRYESGAFLNGLRLVKFPAISQGNLRTDFRCKLSRFPVVVVSVASLTFERLYWLALTLLRDPSTYRWYLLGCRENKMCFRQRPLLQLKHLNLGYNNLLALPERACGMMPNLEELLLSNNLLEWLPREVTGMNFDRFSIGGLKVRLG